jgi:hypothetical protein
VEESELIDEPGIYDWRKKKEMVNKKGKFLSAYSSSTIYIETPESFFLEYKIQQNRQINRHSLLSQTVL